MKDHEIDRRIERLARSQHGVLNHAQAVASGATRSMIEHRVRTGAWLRLAHGVYSLATASPTWRRQYKAAELSVTGSAIAALAAARVHAFDSFRTVRPELAVPYQSNTRNALATLHRTSEIQSTIVDGIRVTTVATTLFDIANRVKVDRLERAMDGALLDRRVSVADLEERTNAHDRSRRPGIGLWRTLVAERSSDAWVPAESELEQTLWTLLLHLDHPTPLVRQAPFPWLERGAGRVDIFAPAWQTIIEADGRRWHARVADFDRDRWRDNLAVAHGLRVLRFTHTHLTQRPDEVLTIIQQTGTRALKAAS